MSLTHLSLRSGLRIAPMWG